MCGIAGTISLTGEHDNQRREAGSVSADMPIVKMIAQMKHRGPDDEGSALFRTRDLEIALGHTRLSIIDLSAAAHQPMGIGNGEFRIADCEEREVGGIAEHIEAKSEEPRAKLGTIRNSQSEIRNSSRFWIVLNGEIYNFRELRQEMEAAGETFISQSDTEVLLRLYARQGTDCLNKLRGMFAFAIWDANLNQLLIARDGFGIKPLYYHATTDTMVFASEVRTLLASGLAPRELSREGLESYLRFGSIESPLTIIKGVRSLSPGHYLVVKHDEKGLRVREHAYATDLAVQAANSKVTDYRDAVRLLRTTLEDSVRSHLVSDVPLGAFLSGGIDSSALVALMSRVAQGRPRTFTVVFEEEEFSEKSFARMVADRFGTQHCEVTLSEESLLHMLPEALAAMDQPTIDGINTYVISEAVKEAGITVALSGLGGDELFAGYPSFRRARQLRNLHVIPSPLRKAVAWAGESAFGGSVQQRKAWRLLHAGGTPQSTYTISRQLFSWEEVAALTTAERIRPRARPSMRSSVDVVNAVSLCELQGYMANTLLRDTDQMSMAHSLEVRVPFVDKEVVSLVLGLKGKWKLNGARAKPLLLDAVWDLLPEEIWRRRKMGFVLPFERWMHTVLRPEMLEAFSNGETLASIGVSESGRAIWQSFDRTPRKERWARPWALYVLKRWCELNEVKL